MTNRELTESRIASAQQWVCANCVDPDIENTILVALDVVHSAEDRAATARLAEQPQGAQAVESYWCAINDCGTVEYGQSIGDVDGGESERRAVNDYINDQPNVGELHLRKLYTAPPPLPEGVSESEWRNAFVAGAKWWEYEKSGATMWQSDQQRAYDAATARLAAGDGADDVDLCAPGELDALATKMQTWPTLDESKYVEVDIDYAEAAQVGELPPLPEWSKRDDLGGLVPSEIRTELRAYARAAIDSQSEEKQ